MKVPLLIHRWFERGGAGWAYHPDLGSRLSACRRELTGKLTGDPGPVGPIEVEAEAFTLIGIRKPDPDRSTDRFDRSIPVLCAVALPGRTDEAGIEELRRQLADFPPPAQAGSNPALELEWRGTLTPFASVASATPPVRRSGLGWIGAAAVAGLLFAVGVFALQGWNANPGSATPPAPTVLASQRDTGPEPPPRPNATETATALIKQINSASPETLQSIPPSEFEPLTSAPEALNQVNRAFFARCETLLNEHAPADFRSWKHASDVDELVAHVDELLRVIPPTEHPLRHGAEADKSPDWEEFRQRVSATIDRHRYERVRYCRESLKKVLDAREPWESSFSALGSSLRKYFQPPGRTTASVQADAVVKNLKKWCDQIDGEREYEFKILNLPSNWRVEMNRKRLERGPDRNVTFKKTFTASSYPTPKITLRDVVLRAPGRDETVWCMVGEKLTTLYKMPGSALDRIKPPDVLLACIVDTENADPRKASLELPPCPDLFRPGESGQPLPPLPGRDNLKPPPRSETSPR